ncbi:hypothetical protein ACP8Y2_20755 [Herpetosiphon llansteffanensis]
MSHFHKLARLFQTAHSPEWAVLALIVIDRVPYAVLLFPIGLR